MHTIIVVDGRGQPLRVACDFCRSEHNYRGGPQNGPRLRQGYGGQAHDTPRPSSAPSVSVPRQAQPMIPPPNQSELEQLLRRVIREETGLTPVTPAEKWRGGELVLRPGKPGLQEKTMPLESFFNKIVMLRNRLRTLEQHVNASDLPDDQKLKLQGYITGCYGSLTSFNVLFADEDDRFVGSSQE